jgi:RNA recognition motif-containing protein
MKIYIANLDSQLSDEDLKALFTPYGEVVSAQVEKDVFTGVSRGYGYVEMSEEAAALKAIEALNRSTVSGLTVSVSPAEPRQEHKGSYKVGDGRVSIYRFKKNK